MNDRTETVNGYVIDVGCIRKNARDDLFEKAKTHTRECALMGHCIESGCGLVTDDDRLVVLDAAATPLVVNAVEASDIEEGIKVRATRERQDDQLKTMAVAKV